MTVQGEDREGASWLDGATRDRLEREFLPGYLPRQRWFASKARALDAVRLIDDAPLVTAPPTDASSRLAFVEVGFHGGATETYFVPLVRVIGPAAERLAPAAIIARLDGSAVIADGLADDGACATLLAQIEAGASRATQSGHVRAFPTTAYAGARRPSGDPLAIARGTIEQSNSAVFYGDRLILKVFRRLEPGTNPDFEIGRFLSERTTFDRIPKTAGAIEYDRPGSEPITLAILQEFVTNQGTGWDHALRELAGYYDRVRGRTDDPSAPGAATAVGDALRDAATLGRRTAELHLALASDPGDPAFAPEPLTAADLAAQEHDVRDQVERTCAVLRRKLGELGPPTDAEARRVLEGVPRLLGQLGGLTALAARAPSKVRIHGDYHLGQVLWTGGDWVILDFEGEPARPLARRREKQSPLKDVVGMLRSFDYAAYAGLFAATRSRPDEFERLAPWARAWRDWTSAAFREAYFSAARGTSLLPTEEATADLLIRAFTLEKAPYELLYELNNRPDWVRIPLQGILALVEEGAAPEKGSIGAR